MEVLINPEIFLHDLKKEALTLLDNILIKYPNCSVAWSDEFYSILYGDINSIFNDRNFSSLLSRIFTRFISNCELENPCNIMPNLLIQNDVITNKLLCIIHSYIHKKYKNLTYIDSTPNIYKCSCECVNNKINCHALFSIDDFYKLNKDLIIKELWPENKDNFYARFADFLNIFGNTYKYNLKEIFYSNEFIKNFINLPIILRENCLEKISLRLQLTQQEAGQNRSLKDEPIEGRKKNSPRWRFRVSKNSCWIHYTKKKDGSIKFEEINIVHDEGL